MAWSSSEHLIPTDVLLSWFDFTKPAPKIPNYTPPTFPISSSARQGMRERQERADKAIQQVPPPLDPYYTNPRDSGQLIPGTLNIDGPHPSLSAVQPLTRDQYLSTTDVFDQYDFSVNSTPILPITSHRERIIKTIEANQVTIIQGSTGSGKSTQVPQYILEHYASQRHHCNIICTQPRRIAAASVARYVGACRKWRVGSLVGYQIAMDKVTSDDTRLTFVTTGVLLMKLINEKNMNRYTHVILDEVHERDKDTDFTLLLVLRLLRTNSRNVKVVLMSATMESEKFAEYFEVKSSQEIIRPPILNVEGHAYPVTEFFLESLRDLGRCDPPSIESPGVTHETMDLACNLLHHFDQLEQNQTLPFRGTVLVFLPGMPEIREMEELLIVKCSKLKLTTLPLHSTISSDEQMRVFLKPDEGHRKVILATNIAESSITVPDIRYVIDFCLTKQLMCDQQTNYQYLKLCWASKASLTQRKGRAGRVSNGRCYRLVTENFYVKFMEDESPPEIARCPIESLVLYTKQLDIGDPKSVLRWAITPPKLHGIERAVLILKEVGGLTLTMKGEVNPYDGHLTFLGQVLASLPVDVKVGKLLILGHIFGCLEECLVIGAALSLKSIFTQPYHDAFLNAYKSKISWCRGTFSDCMAILNAYKEWYAMKSDGRFMNDKKTEKNWCNRNLINNAVIREVGNLVEELRSRLDKFNICVTKNLISSRCQDMTPNEILLLKLVIAGAFYPNYFYWGEIDEDNSRREMSGHDPTTTIMVSGMPPNSHEFSEELADVFSDCGKGKALHFEQSRLYVEFERPRNKGVQKLGKASQGGMLDSVYIALKKRHRRDPLSVTILSSKLNSSSSNDQLTASQQSSYQKREIPLAELNKEKGFHLVFVLEVIDPGHFWAHYATASTRSNLRQLMETIGSLKKPRPLSEKVPIKEMSGHYCLALYSVDGLYYRGYIDSVGDKLAQVVFVDYGNEECVPLNFVLQLPEELYSIPRQAFECYMAGIKPAYGGKRDGCWSSEAKCRFQDLVMGKHLFINVYSEVDGILRVDLWDTSDSTKDVHINEVLVKEGWASHYQEPLTSKLAHDALERLSLSAYDKTKRPVVHSVSLPWPSRSLMQRGPPRGRTTTWKLKGPSNPYEVSFYSMARGGGLRSCKVERESVNCIVLNDEPQDKQQRLMVACQVALNPTGSTVLARHTTLLPNIHGLSHLVSLLFAPSIELRVDPLKRQYIGAICGLGFCPSTGTSVFPDHDMELTFDTVITQRDIDAINVIRSQINLALDTDDDSINWGKDIFKKMQQKTRDTLINLILTPRQTMEPINSMRAGWNLISPDDLLVPSQPAPLDQQPGGGSTVISPLYQLHSGVNVTGERVTSNRVTERIILLQKVKELRSQVMRSQETFTLTCPLCKITAMSTIELKKHFSDRMHLIQVEQLEESLQETGKTETPLLTPAMWRSMYSQ